jgi:hypothetical protein
MKRKGFAVLSLTIFFVIFTTGLLIVAHFVGQRIRAMQRLQKIENRIHHLHRHDFHGRRSFWPSTDRPSKEAQARGLTRRKKAEKQMISIDFGE